MIYKEALQQLEENYKVSIGIGDDLLFKLNENVDPDYLVSVLIDILDNTGTLATEPFIKPLVSKILGNNNYFVGLKGRVYGWFDLSKDKKNIIFKPAMEETIDVGIINDENKVTKVRPLAFRKVLTVEEVISILKSQLDPITADIPLSDRLENAVIYLENFILSKLTADDIFFIDDTEDL